MPGSIPQAAFFYQNHVAALKVLELLAFGTPITSILLENYEKGPHIDDIIVVYAHSTRYYQVKWSQNNDKPFTISNLIQKEENEKSLIQQLAEGYKSAYANQEDMEIILYSTREASNHKGRYKHSLQDFLNNIHAPFIASPLHAKLSELPSYGEHKSIIDAWKSASGLDEVTFDEFLRHLRFELDQDNLQRQRQKILTKLALLGISERLFDTLLIAVVEWSISGTAITKTEILKKLGIAHRLIDTVAQDYGVEKNHYVENTFLFEQLDKAIAHLPGGFILVDGPPGIGKSTALTVYQRTRPQAKFAYYCFVPHEISLGNRRMEKETFLKSLCIGIRNAFPDKNFSHPYSEDYENLLEQWLHELSTLDTKMVFIIDGVDYVDKRKAGLSSPLTNYLVGKLPNNIFFLLSSQYPEALSVDIQTQIRQNPLRHITMQRFIEPKIDSFLHRWGLRLAPRERVLVIEKTEGIPLYLNYVARLLHDTPRTDYEATLKELPRIIRDETIDFYHEFLYQHISHNELTVWLLAILARRKEYTTTIILLELLTLLNVQSNAHLVQQSLRTFKHLLKVVDTDLYDIFHNSFREFLLEKTDHLDYPINAALTGYYRSKLNSDESYRQFYRHLFELEQYDEMLSYCNEEWLKQSWRDFRPFAEVNANIDLAWEAAIQLGSFKEFIRIAFLKQQLAVIQNNLEAANEAHATFLLRIGKSKEAIRKVWDGELVQCSLVEFSQFVLDYFKSTRALLPERVIRSGFSKSKGQLKPQEAAIYYQAQALYFDWEPLFNKVDRTHWGTIKRHDDLQPSSKEENDRIKNSLKEKIIDVLFVAQKYEALLTIGRDQNIPLFLRNLALINAIDLCLRWDEVDEVLKLVKMVDFQELNRQHFARLIVLLFEKGCLEKAQGLLPLHYLPLPLTSYQLDESMNRNIDEQFALLYNDLRAYFSLNPEGYSTHALQVSSLAHTEKTFFGAAVELASIWCDHIRGAQKTKQISRKIMAFFTDLHNFYDASEYEGDNSIIERNLALYRKIIEFTTRFLSPSQMREVAEHWLQLEANSGGNLDISLDFAKYFFECNVSSLETIISQLLTTAEAQARRDEETTVLVTRLMSCAEVYGYCGLGHEAIRIWDELYMLACGIYYRKDYQFNEAISVLHITHKYYPEKSAQRLTKLLGLAHQLEDVARSRTLAQAITALIVFSSKLSAGLALELLRREDTWVHREETIKRVTRTFVELPNNNLWYVWAIVKTMNKWDNLTYDDETYPAMRYIFEAALNSNDHNLALDVYTFSRHQFLVEKNTPWRLFELADLCKQYGMVLGEVENDWQAF
ncbi:MAG TPA: dsDNA nuclease domain-containing protein, partial [Ktedonobacteraceae bacterium]|nr:dsDNA nuclease domain-containing protein [Ktedonobacteraceae bacterium]